MLNFKKKIIKNFSNVKMLSFYKGKILKLGDKIEYVESRNSKNL